MKLGDDPQPPAVTNQGATLFLKEGFERTALAPVICVGSFSPHLFSIQPSLQNSRKQSVSVFLVGGKTSSCVVWSCQSRVCIMDASCLTVKRQKKKKKVQNCSDTSYLLACVD